MYPLQPVDKLSARVGVGKSLAISYTRVSTGSQALDDVSGVDRQLAAINKWLVEHPEYELDRKIDQVGSGAKAGRFEWFITELQQGRLPKGTCLVVEKISRLTREDVTASLRTLIRIFDAGGAIACCQLGGAVLRSLNSEDGAVFMLVGAIQSARIEWEERRDRKVFADKKKHQSIIQGEKPFSPRSKDKSRADYPFWLEFNESTYEFKIIEDHARWIREAFVLAERKGSPAVARYLYEKGVRCPQQTKKSLSFKAVLKLLKNRALLGERQLYHAGHDGRSVPKGKAVKGVYPPVITQQQWDRTQAAISKRHNGQSPTGARMHNLFERRIVCSQCGGLVGFKNDIGYLSGGIKKLYPKLYCLNSKMRVDACDAPFCRYDENAFLDRIQSVRWSEYFRDSDHDEQVARARKTLLAAQENREVKAQQLGNLRSNLGEMMRAGVIAMVELANSELEAASQAFDEADRRLNLAQSAFDSLLRRPTGMAAERAIKAKLKEYRDSGLVDIESRREFNGWLASEEILIELDLTSGRFELGTAIYRSNGALEGLDQRLDDAAALGIDLEQARVAMVATQSSKNSDAPNRQNDKASSEQLRRLKSQMDQFVRDRDAALAADPPKSTFPQPEKAWAGVDLEPLKRLANEFKQDP